MRHHLIIHALNRLSISLTNFGNCCEVYLGEVINGLSEAILRLVLRDKWFNRYFYAWVTYKIRTYRNVHLSRILVNCLQKFICQFARSFLRFCWDKQSKTWQLDWFLLYLTDLFQKFCQPAPDLRVKLNLFFFYLFLWAGLWI